MAGRAAKSTHSCRGITPPERPRLVASDSRSSNRGPPIKPLGVSQLRATCGPHRTDTPLYRLSEMYDRLGIDISRSVMADWVGSSPELGADIEAHFGSQRALPISDR
nr:transposase [Sinorhizobium meliloti]